MRLIIFILALVATISCNQNKTESTKTIESNSAMDSAQKAIKAAFDYHMNAVNKYDGKACGELFADDAIIIQRGPETLYFKGRNEIDSFMIHDCEILKGQAAKLDVKRDMSSIKINGDMAYQNESMVYTIKIPGKDDTHLKGNLLIAWKKTGDAQWKAHTWVFYPG